MGIRKLLVVSAFGWVAATAAMQAFAEADSLELADVRSETRLETVFALLPQMRGSDIRVSVVHGNAILEGRVDEEVRRVLAETIARAAPGIMSVDNRIRVHDANGELRVGNGHHDLCMLAHRWWCCGGS